MSKTPAGLRKQRAKPFKKEVKPRRRTPESWVSSRKAASDPPLPVYKDPELGPDPTVLRAHDVERARDVVVVDSRIQEISDLHAVLRNESNQEYCAAGCKGWPCATRKILGSV